MTKKKGNEEALIVDASLIGNDSKYINHSCMPNCEAVFEQNGTKTPHIKFKALKKIQIGDELSINYRLKKIPGKQIECLCGKKKPNIILDRFKN